MTLANGFDPDYASAADWAAQYRAHGIQVIPCKGKIPARPWQQFQNVLMTQDQFNRWYGPTGEFARYESMGMLTGSCSGNVLMIDLDLYKPAGVLAKQWWFGLLGLHHHDMELETWEQLTGGGGKQMFFTYPPGWRGAVNSKTDLCVDTRGQGGFAVLPPSKHASGEQYRWREGRAPWEIPILQAPEWLLDEVLKLVREHGGGQVVEGHFQPSTSLFQPSNEGTKINTAQEGTIHGHVVSPRDSFGHLTDLREDKMYRLIWGAVVDFYRERYVMSDDGYPEPPSEADSQAREEEKYLIFRDYIAPKTTETEIPANRGREAFHVKWQRAIGQWGGKVRQEALKPNPKTGEIFEPGHNSPQPAPVIDPKTGKTPILEYLNVRQIKAQPDPVWMIDKLINERGLGFIFGPPSSLKTFLALDIALTSAARLASWWGRKVNQHGAVIYLCREGVASLKFRIMAWEKHRQTIADDAPFFLIRKNLNFMKPEDIVILLATVEEIAAKAGAPIAAVFVDTVSRVLPGAKENQQEDMTLFIAACEEVQHRFNCVVVGVHHTNKNGDIRGSTVIPGAGDFLIETRRETPAMTGSIYIHKVKDDEDGIELQFKVTKLELGGGLTPRTSLVVDPSEDAVNKVKDWHDDGLPDRAICREILGAIASAWFRGVPWSVDNSAHPAVQMIMARWFLKRDAVKRLLAGWMANGIIEHTDFPGKKKVKGYRKLIDL